MGTEQSETPTVQIAQEGLPRRMLRAIKLDSTIYEQVEHDPGANTQSLYIIGMVSVAQAIGLAIGDLFIGGPVGDIPLTAAEGFAITIIGLAIWSYLLYLVGTKVFHGVATPGEVWRTTGYARSPGVLLIIPFIGLFVNIWIFIAYIIAARQSLDVTTGKAVAAVIISAIPYIIILGVISYLIF